MRTKGTTSFTEGKAGYFKIFIHGRSAENETGNFICSYADFLTIAGDYVITATGVYGAGYKAAVLLNPQVFLPGKPANNTSPAMWRPPCAPAPITIASTGWL